MLPVTTLGTLLLLYVRCCLSNVLSLAGTGQLLNWMIFCQRGAQKLRGQPTWVPPSLSSSRSSSSMPRPSSLFPSSSLPPVVGGSNGVHGPSGPLHHGGGLSPLVHTLPASLFLMVDAPDHQNLLLLFKYHCQWWSGDLRSCVGRLTFIILFVSSAITCNSWSLHVIEAGSVWLERCVGLCWNDLWWDTLLT